MASVSALHLAYGREDLIAAPRESLRRVTAEAGAGSGDEHTFRHVSRSLTSGPASMNRRRGLFSTVLSCQLEFRRRRQYRRFDKHWRHAGTGNVPQRTTPRPATRRSPAVEGRALR